MSFYTDKIEQTKASFERYWNRENTDRCLISVTAPRQGVAWEPAAAGVSPETKWLDVDYRIDRFKKDIKPLYFGGEAIPVYFLNLGPGVLAEFMGGGFVLGEDTVWFEREQPPIRDYGSRAPLRLSSDTRMYKVMRALQRRCAEEGIFVTTTDLGGSLDIAASLRGTQNVLMDTVCEPEALSGLLQEIDACWNRAIEDIFAFDRQNQQGYSSWLALWSSKTFYPLQCDLSVNLSTEMFQEFVMPSLKRQSEQLERVVYHLDGPGEIRHLDTLLTLPRLDAIECVPLPDGRGWLDVANPMWMDVYRRIQRAGKNLIIRCVSPDKLKELLTSLSHRGLFISTHVGSPQEAEDLLRAAEIWAREVK